MQQLTNINNAILTMTSREMADLTEKRHDSVKRTIETLANNDTISHPQIVDGEKAANGVSEKIYLIGKRDSYIVVAQLSPEFTARLVDRWQELEAKQAAPVALSTMDILTLAMESEKGRLLAIEQRDYAIATKAHIGSKREATAMATASAAKKEVVNLKHQLGFSARHATIMQVEAATGQEFSFVELRRWCQAHEVIAEVVPDKRYPKGVKAWPAAAWRDIYFVELVELFGEVTA